MKKYIVNVRFYDWDGSTNSTEIEIEAGNSAEAKKAAEEICMKNESILEAEAFSVEESENFDNERPAASPAEKIGAALGGLSMLGARVSVYVPATCGTADAADNAREVDAVASTLSAWFGGATIQPGAGCWMSDTCGLVKEQTTVVYAACTAEQLADRIAALRELCENLKAEMQQEAVAMQIDGIPGASGLYFI